MALGKKSVIAMASAASVIVLGVGLAVGVNAYADANARSAFEEAVSEQQTAERAVKTSVAELDEAKTVALEAHTRGLALHSITDDAMIADPAAKTNLAHSLSALAEAANINPAEPSDQQTDAGSTETNQQPRTHADPRDPSTLDRAALKEATAEARTRASAAQSQSKKTEREAKLIDTAVDAVHKSEDDLVAAARAKAAQTEVPELASAESKEAFAGAVATLTQPAEDADLVALIQSYQDAWQAVVASNAQAMQASDPASIEPTYIRGILVVNKSYALPSWYGDGLTAETVAAFDQMQAEAAAQGLNLYISSGFRSYGAQESIYNRYVAADGRAEADRYSARPGHSEHQSGLTFDLNTIDEAFAYTAEGQWVRDNAHRFGFVIRYPQGKEHITGYIWEPWHLRYLGVGVATELYSSGLSLEEYLGITSQYAD